MGTDGYHINEKKLKWVRSQAGRQKATVSILEDSLVRSLR